MRHSFLDKEDGNLPYDKETFQEIKEFAKSKGFELETDALGGSFDTLKKRKAKKGIRKAKMTYRKNEGEKFPIESPKLIFVTWKFQGPDYGTENLFDNMNLIMDEFEKLNPATEQFIILWRPACIQ